MQESTAVIERENCFHHLQLEQAVRAKAKVNVITVLKTLKRRENSAAFQKYMRCFIREFRI